MFGDEHIHVFYIHAKFRDEMTFLLLCAKKTNPVTKMRFKKYVFRAVIFFLHRAEDIHFITKICKYVENMYMFITKKIQNFLKCFTIFYDLFIGPGAGELGFQSEFLTYASLIYHSPIQS